MSIANVPAFVLETDAVADVDGIGKVGYAMVYGGNFYPVIEAAQLSLELDLRNKDKLIGVGLRIIDAVNEQRPAVHLKIRPSAASTMRSSLKFSRAPSRTGGDTVT